MEKCSSQAKLLFWLRKTRGRCCLYVRENETNSVIISVSIVSTSKWFWSRILCSMRKKKKKKSVVMIDWLFIWICFRSQTSIYTHSVQDGDWSIECIFFFFLNRIVMGNMRRKVDSWSVLTASKTQSIIFLLMSLSNNLDWNINTRKKKQHCIKSSRAAALWCLFTCTLMISLMLI